MSAVAAQPSLTGPLWHPFARHGGGRAARFVSSAPRASGSGMRPDAATWMPRPGSGTRTSATGVPSRRRGRRPARAPRRVQHLRRQRERAGARPGRRLASLRRRRARASFSAPAAATRSRPRRSRPRALPADGDARAHTPARAATAIRHPRHRHRHRRDRAQHRGLGPAVAGSSAIADDDPEALEREIDRLGAGRVAAFFCEPVIGAGGVIPPPPGYIEAVAEICARTGVLFVADCVICGFGRLGTWLGMIAGRCSPTW